MISTCLKVYELRKDHGFEIHPCPVQRDWMDMTWNSFAYHCTPLTDANVFGWFIPSPCDFTAVWDGSANRNSVGISFHRERDVERYSNAIHSRFGTGILTIAFPYIFKTSPATWMEVRGVPNFHLPGIQPCEGLVQTDIPKGFFTFTMNWRLMEPFKAATFYEGYPLCFLRPITPDPIEATIQPVEENEELWAGYTKWKAERNELDRQILKGEAKPGEHDTYAKSGAIKVRPFPPLEMSQRGQTGADHGAPDPGTPADAPSPEEPPLSPGPDASSPAGDQEPPAATP